MCSPSILSCSTASIARLRSTGKTRTLGGFSLSTSRNTPSFPASRTWWRPSWGRLPPQVQHLVDLPFKEAELMLIERRRVHGKQEDGAVHRNLVAQGLDEAKHGEEVVVRDEIVDAVDEDGTLLGRDELSEGGRKLLEVLRSDGVLFADIAQPQDRNPFQAVRFPDLLGESSADAEPLPTGCDRLDQKLISRSGGLLLHQVCR